MKDANIKRIFGLAVKAKVEKADANGTKTSWDTADHLATLAKALAQADIPAGAEPEAVFLAVIEDAYNISAYQQLLATAFKEKGHFQRETKKRESTGDFYSRMGIS